MAELSAFGVLLFAILGASFGSFSAMLLSRKTLELKVLSKPSKCDSCGKPIAWYRNLPLVAWPMLRGKCANCKARIPIRYWLIEISTAIAFSLLWLASAPNLLLAAFLSALFVVTLLIAFWDIDTMKIPNRLVLVAIAISVALGVNQSLANPGSSSLVYGLVGAFCYSALLWLTRVMKPGGMGLGDVKLAIPLGAVSGLFGLQLVATSIFLAFLCGAAVGVGQIALGKASSKSTMPFGPWMVLGFWLSLIFGGKLWSAYLEVIASVVS